MCHFCEMYLRAKIVYIVSEVEKSLAFEWIAQSIDREKFDLHFILLGKSDTILAYELKKMSVNVFEFPLGNKFVIFVTFLRVLKSLFQIKPDIIHTHLFYANLIGLTAGNLLCVPKRVVTRHHAMIHYNEYPQGLKWDKYINRIATHVIAISENIKKILLEQDEADPTKIKVIHHGFDLHYFETMDNERVQIVKHKYITEDKYPVVGVISRYLKLKGVEYVIEAFKQLLIAFPNAHLILANANGNYKSEIKKTLQSLPQNSFTEIEFENDLVSLYKFFDVYVHVPIGEKSEAFGQTYVEALASGVPSVFTLSGVASEFIVHEQNALVVPFQNAEVIREAIVRILSDVSLREKLISNGKQSVKSFSVDKMINALSSLYEG